MAQGTDTAVKERVKSELREPSLFKVIYINDDATTMEFVVESLMTVFGHSQEVSENITMEIHTQGSSVVAVLPFELAEQKGLEVTTMARNQGYPLLVQIEEDQ
jgi:ATP-dependent Clp protease adaptor protein ClpS